MSLELLGGQHTADGMMVTFATESGVELLHGTREEVARLAEVMQQVSVLAALNDDENVWLDNVTVGDALVGLGISPGGKARVRIIRL